MRGRRVALLLPGVLPLLAEDDIPKTPSIPEDIQATVDRHDDEHDDVSPLRSAARALHEDEALTALPALPLDLVQKFDPSQDLVLVDVMALSDDDANQMCLLDVYNFTAIGNRTKPGKPLGDSAKEESQSLRHDDEVTASEIATFDETTVGAKDDDDDEDEASSAEPLVVDYASKSAGGLVLESSPSMTGASNLLHGDKDKYAIAPCQDKKKIVIGLSEDILVKQVKLANYERYSSQVETFQILGSQTMGNWVDLGTYKAEPQNGEQTFDLEEPAWARYLTFRFVSHYGSEHYCTISQIKVHGSTMLQGFHEQWKDTEEETNQLDGDVGRLESEAPVQQDEAVVDDATVERTLDGSPEVRDSTDDGGSALTASTDTSSTLDIDLVQDDSEQIESDPSSVTSMEEMDPSDDPDESVAGDYIASDDATAAQGGEDSSLDGLDGSDVSVGASLGDSTATSAKQDGPSHMPQATDDGLQDSGSPAALQSVSIQLSSSNSADMGLKGSTVELGIDSIMTVGAVTSVVKHSAVETSTVKDILTASGDGAEPQQEPAPMRSVSFPDGMTEHPVNEAPPSTNEPEEPFSLKTPDGKADGDMGSTATYNAHHASEVVNGAQDDQSADSKEPIGDPGHMLGASTDTGMTTGLPESSVPTDPVDPEKKAAALAERDEGPSVDLDALALLLGRFPNAACMKDLDYNDFRARIVAARKGGPSSAPANAAAGRLEPIFKTLTDEIKSLQINNSAQKQYSKAMTSCYQQVIVDLMSELDGQQRLYDTRLSNLERTISDIQSVSWAAASTELAINVAFWCSVAFGFVLVWTENIRNGDVARAIVGNELVGAMLVVGTCLTFLLLRRRAKPRSTETRKVEAKTTVPDPPAANPLSSSPTPSLIGSIEIPTSTEQVPYGMMTTIDQSSLTPPQALVKRSDHEKYDVK